MTGAPHNGRCTACRRLLLVQKYYTVPELAWHFGFSETTIREWMRAGLFGSQEEFLRRGNDIRVPQSGALFFIEAHLNKKTQAQRLADQVRGRTLGEARRKLEECPNV
jgi:hypothetical protein